MPADRAFEVAARLAPEPVGHPPRQEFRLPGHQQHWPVRAPFECHHSAAAHGTDAAGEAAERKSAAVGEGRSRREAAHPFLQPGDVAAQEVLAVDEGCAGGEGQNRQAERLVDPEDEPFCAGIPPDHDGNFPPRGRDQQLLGGAFQDRKHGQFLPRVRPAGKRQNTCRPGIKY